MIGLKQKTHQPKIWVIQGKQDPTEISPLQGLRSPIEYWGVMGMIFWVDPNQYHPRTQVSSHEQSSQSVKKVWTKFSSRRPKFDIPTWGNVAFWQSVVSNKTRKGRTPDWKI